MLLLRFKEDELSVSSSSSSSSSSNIDCRTAQSSAVCVMDVSAETEAATLAPPPRTLLVPTLGRPAADAVAEEEEVPLVPRCDWYLPPTSSCSSAPKSLLSSLSSLSKSTRSNRSRSGSISRAAAPPPEAAEAAAAEEGPAPPAEGRPLTALAAAAAAAGRRA